MDSRACGFLGLALVAIRLSAESQLSAHRDGIVSVSCPACHHERNMPAAALARIIGWDTPLSAALRRLRCSACGARRARVSIHYPRRPRGWNSHP